jgi:hypothetical protein
MKKFKDQWHIFDIIYGLLALCILFVYAKKSLLTWSIPWYFKNLYGFDTIPFPTKELLIFIFITLAFLLVYFISRCLFVRIKVRDRNKCNHIWEILREASSSLKQGGLIDPAVLKCRNCGITLTVPEAFSLSAHRQQSITTAVLIVTAIMSFCMLSITVSTFISSYRSSKIKQFCYLLATDDPRYLDEPDFTKRNEFSKTYYDACITGRGIK